MAEKSFCVLRKDFQWLILRRIATPNDIKALYDLAEDVLMD
jgi:hypothetical protein